MADTKISAMPVATILNAADIIPIVQGGANKSATPVLIGTYMASIGSPPVDTIAVTFFGGA